VHCFGSEVSMQGYIRARPDIFFTGRDGSLRSNRALCQVAGLYACDLFIGATLKIWLEDMPNGRLLRKQGIASAVAFLSSNAASGINGHLLMVDTGYSIS
jgi:NAD(P)-dependent dehydrogenase (short-subunit alcohol dehydrogenase family)